MSASRNRLEILLSFLFFPFYTFSISHSYPDDKTLDGERKIRLKTPLSLSLSLSLSVLKTHSKGIPPSPLIRIYLAGG